MKLMVFGFLAVAAVGAAIFMFPTGGLTANSYEMTLGEATKKLRQADRRLGKAPFGSTQVQALLPVRNVVQFTGGRFDCRAEFTEQDAAYVTVATTCQGRERSSAQAKARDEMTEVAFAEFVASTLSGRPFNETVVKAGNFGSVVRNLPAMQQEALEAERQMRGFSQQGGPSSDAEAPPEEADDWGSEIPPPDYAREGSAW